MSADGRTVGDDRSTGAVELVDDVGTRIAGHRQGGDAAPGQTDVGLSTSGVPTGTTVNVTVKPRVGGVPIVTPVTLTSCDPNGACLANVTFNLAAGGYFIEARATFSTP